MMSGRGTAPAPAWPAPEAWLDLSGGEHYSDGSARCTGVALCDANLRPCRSFSQGQDMHVYYAFDVDDATEVVSAGLEFSDTMGRVIHGRNSFQFGTVVAATAGTELRVHHVVRLDVGVGDYVLGVGLATADRRAYEAFRARELPHDRFDARCRELARVRAVTTFAVTLPADGYLAFHGGTDLPGSQSIASQASGLTPAGARPAAPGRRDESSERGGAPPIVHVTHWKAGSQWIYKILDACAPDLIVAPQLGEAQFVHWPIRRGAVYPTVYVTYQQYCAAKPPDDTARFVVVRDLRDTLVSAWFSFGGVHPTLEPGMASLRAVLESADRDTGLVYLMDNWLARSAAIQISWIEAGEPLIRYEDLLSDDEAILERALIDRCRLPVTRARLREVVAANRFERITAGRRRGQEDRAAHERKGVAGDWRNHFSDRVTRAFKTRFGGVLVATGYERDLDW